MNNELTNWVSKGVNTQLDGDWEHELGMSLTMIDNPGWDFNVDLVNYENQLEDIAYILKECGLNDWIGFKVENSYLNIAGDVNKLSFILNLFKSVILYLEADNTNKKMTKSVLLELFDILHNHLGL